MKNGFLETEEINIKIYIYIHMYIIYYILFELGRPHKRAKE